MKALLAIMALLMLRADVQGNESAGASLGSGVGALLRTSGEKMAKKRQERQGRAEASERAESYSDRFYGAGVCQVTTDVNSETITHSFRCPFPGFGKAPSFTVLYERSLIKESHAITVMLQSFLAPPNWREGTVHYRYKFEGGEAVFFRGRAFTFGSETDPIYTLFIDGTDEVGSFINEVMSGKSEVTFLLSENPDFFQTIQIPRMADIGVRDFTGRCLDSSGKN